MENPVNVALEIIRRSLEGKKIKIIEINNDNIDPKYRKLHSYLNDIIIRINIDNIDLKYRKLRSYPNAIINGTNKEIFISLIDILIKICTHLSPNHLRNFLTSSKSLREAILSFKSIFFSLLSEPLWKEFSNDTSGSELQKEIGTESIIYHLPFNAAICSPEYFSLHRGVARLYLGDFDMIPKDKKILWNFTHVDLLTARAKTINQEQYKLIGEIFPKLKSLALYEFGGENIDLGKSEFLEYITVNLDNHIRKLMLSPSARFLKFNSELLSSTCEIDLQKLTKPTLKVL
jgi:hypothetical protein